MASIGFNNKRRTMNKRIHRLLVIAICGVVLVSAGTDNANHRRKDLETKPDKRQGVKSTGDLDWNDSKSNSDSDSDEDDFNLHYLHNDCNLDWFSKNAQTAGDKAEFYGPNSPEARLATKVYRECKSNFTRQIEQTVGNLTEEEKEDIELLTEDIIKGAKEDNELYILSSTDLDISSLKSGMEKLTERLVRRLDEKVGLDGVVGRVRAIEEVSAKIKSLCQKTSKRLEQIINFIDLLIHTYEWNVNYFEDHNQEWLIRAKVCERILDRFQPTIRENCAKAFIRKHLDKNEPERKQLEKWDELKIKVFNEDTAAKAIPATDLFGYLRTLEEISTIISPLGLLSLDDQWRASTLKELVWLGEITETKCNPRTFERFHIHKMTYKFRPKSILEYLKHFSELQYKFCEPGLKQQLDRAIAGLDEKQQDELRLFSDSSLDSDRYQDVMTVQGVSHGALAVLNAKGLKPTRRTKAEKIERMLEQSIGVLCRKVTSSHIFDFYRIIMIDEDLKNLLDQETSKWVLRYRMCKLYGRNRADVIRDFQEILSEKSGRFCGLF